MLKETINSQSFTQGLANHFGTKASIKNMLSGKKNMRAIQPLFEDTNYAEEILEYGNIREVLTGILDDVFKEYIKVFNKKLPEGELGNTKDRVQMFIGLFDERLNKEPEGGIISSFADFAKSATGKKIAKVLKDSGNGSNEDLMDLIAYIAIRSVIINADKLVEPSKKGELVEVSEPPVLVEEPQESEPIEMDAEVIPPESYPHTKNHINVEEEHKELVDPIVELNMILENLADHSDEEIKRIINMVCYGTTPEEFENKINKYPSKSQNYDIADNIECMMPTNRKKHIASINVGSFIRFVLDITNTNVETIFEVNDENLLVGMYNVFSALGILLSNPSPQKFFTDLILANKRLVVSGIEELKKLPNLVDDVNSRIEERRKPSIFDNIISSVMLINDSKNRVKKAYTKYGIL